MAYQHIYVIKVIFLLATSTPPWKASMTCWCLVRILQGLHGHWPSCTTGYQVTFHAWNHLWCSDDITTWWNTPSLAHLTVTVYHRLWVSDSMMIEICHWTLSVQTDLWFPLTSQHSHHCEMSKNHTCTCPPLIPFTVTVYSRLWRLKCVTTKNMNNSYEMIQSQQQRLYMFSKIEQLTALFLTYFPKSNFPKLCILYLPKIKNIMFYYQGTGATSQSHHTHLINMENQ